MLGDYFCYKAISDGIVTAPNFVEMNVFGQGKFWQATCERIGALSSAQLSLYSGFGGSGCDASKTVATRKAICELIERWARSDVVQGSAEWQKCGFDLDPSSNGMAAYPELWCSRVKEKARNEAVERWALLAWWFGKIGSTKLTELQDDLNGIQLSIPLSRSMVVLWKETADFVCFGFAADTQKRNAIFRASVELTRNFHVLKKWNGYSLPEQAHIIEKRLTFFAKNGFPLFLDRLHKSLALQTHLDIPSFKIDTEVYGPWTKYAKVWRSLIEGEPTWQNYQNLEVFLF